MKLPRLARRGSPPDREDAQSTSTRSIRGVLIFFMLLSALLFNGCAALPRRSTPPDLPTKALQVVGLSEEQAATLASLQKLDAHPLYSMRYYGDYRAREAATHPVLSAGLPAWACSLFAAFGDQEDMYYGRNFDWSYSPTVLLFTDPPDGYASMSMVDIAYLGFGGEKAGELGGLPLGEREALLETPFLPFDGMNERGLVVGMAAVPPGQGPPDPEKETIGLLEVIREMLDWAATVDEALVIMRRYNIDMTGGTPIHYLIADTSGRAALVEFYQGEMVVIPNEEPWHQATNFLRAAQGASPEGVCWRYERISQRLSESEGRLTALDAMDLLAEVSQENTQWSVVYGMHAGEAQVVMDRRFGHVYTFSLENAGE